MRKLEGYIIVTGRTSIELSEQVLYMIKSYNYELIGGAFWDGERYCQTIVKYS